MNKILHIKSGETHWWKVCIVLIVLCLLTGYKPSSAQTKIDSLRNRLKVETKDSMRVVAMVSLSRELHRVRVADEEYFDIATQAMDMASTIDTMLYARTMNNLGLLYRYHQLYGEAIALHVKAYELIADRESYPIDKMTFANNAGVAFRYNTKYDLAVDYYMKALRIAEREKNMRNIEISCNGLGNTFMAIPGREDEGFAYLEKALEVAKKEENQRGMAIQYLTIGKYYDQREQYDKSRSYFDELLKINEDIKDEKGKGMAYQALGESYLKEGVDLERSKRYFDYALAVFKQINERQQQAYTLLELGYLGMGKQAYTEGLSSLEQAMRIAEELNDKQLIQAVSEATSKLYEATHNYPMALRYHKRARDYQDSINMSDQMVQISAINRRYNLEKKESEIALLKKEQDIQNMQLEKHLTGLKNRGVIIALLIILFVTLGLVFILQGRNRKHKRKAEAELIKKESDRLKAIYEKNLAETEILANQMRVNPHFLFNCLNSIKNLIQHNENKQAIKYLVMLARFSRLVLETANRPVHSLDEELALIKYYIELEKNRFDDGFCFTVDNLLGEQASEVELPSLLLQPFVENAIWHGLLPSNKSVKILSITIERENDTYKIIIDDTGVGRQYDNISPKQHKSRGTEINDKRIELYNKNNPNTIHYEFLDKKDERGLALGTCVFIHIKTTNSYENCYT